MTRRQQHLMEVAKEVSNLNSNADMSFEVFPYEGDYALSILTLMEHLSFWCSIHLQNIGGKNELI